MDNSQPLMLFEDDALVQTKGDLLAHYERVIERGQETFVEVGMAYMAIRDGELYKKKGYKSFEQYCKDEWGVGRNYANKIISAAGVVTNLGTMVPILPTTERQARPLRTLEPEEQREAWAEVVATAPDGKVTAAHVEAVVERRVAPAMSVHYTSDTPEHYTPDEVLDAVVECLGMIDLDPCSNSQGDPHVPATHHYTKEDDGLSQFWHGRVFMNPPYGDEIGKWVDKLCSEELAQRVKEAIVLVPARTDTAWFDRLIDGYRPICFVHGRLKFVSSDGRTQSSAPFPSAIVYYGTEIDRFYNAFASFGAILQEVHPELSFGR